MRLTSFRRYRPSKSASRWAHTIDIRACGLWPSKHLRINVGNRNTSSEKSACAALLFPEHHGESRRTVLPILIRNFLLCEPKVADRELLTRGGEKQG